MKSNQTVYKVGTRQSPLALAQVQEVFQAIRRINPNFEAQIIGTKTLGDKDKKTSISKTEDTDFFTKEIDRALLNKKIDFAVHSAKDLPNPLPRGIKIAAFTQSIEASDALVSKGNLKLKELPRGARIGASSRRRKGQLKRLRPDLKIIDIRGTINERLKKLEEGKLDAVIVASIALIRLGLKNKITEKLSPQPFPPHPLQGSLAITVRKNDKCLKRIFSKLDKKKLSIKSSDRKGVVFLVGAGPGDPNLITVKGLEVLKRADVILYDHLVRKALLKKARSRAELIFVGKRKDYHLMPQEEINQLMHAKVIEGKVVVRLKGGDPFIFGRGGEEAVYLKENGIQVEIVPGLSSISACPTAGGIPLTHRDIASSFAVVNGHPTGKRNPVSVPEADTLIYLMCVSNLEEIIKAIKKKKAPDTPCALIEEGTTQNEKVIVGTLSNIASKAKARNLKPPAIFIVGEVIELKGKIRPPRILVTGTSIDRFRPLGEIIHSPMITIKPLNQFKQADLVIKKIDKFDLLLFTSQYGVQFFLERYLKKRKTLNYLKEKTLIAIGKTTARELKKFNLKASLVPWEESAAGICKMQGRFNLKEKRILIPRSSLARNEMVRELRRRGAQAAPLTIYRNLPIKAKKQNLSNIDEIVFSSPSGVDNFFKKYKNIPEGIACRVIGPVTETALKKYAKNNEVIRHVS